MTADSEATFYSAAIRRVYRLMLILAAPGLLAAWWIGGWRAAVGFAAGAAGSYFNFSWLHQAVEAMGPDARPTRKRVLVLLALRYLILAAGAYVIVRVFRMNSIALLSGLFVPVAAVIAEGLYELTHGT